MILLSFGWKAKDVACGEQGNKTVTSCIKACTTVFRNIIPINRAITNLRFKCIGMHNSTYIIPFLKNVFDSKQQGIYLTGLSTS